MKSLLCLLTLLFCIVCGLSSQESIYPVTNYTTKNYGRDFHPTNMAVVQDQRGIIYAANGFKLLEFDGHSWKSYPINKETWILSLAVDSSGIIYAGSQNEFGRFVPDNRGELKYQSISDSLDLKDRDFKNVWKVHAFSEGVVFQSEEKLFLYRKGKTEVIRPETSFHTSFIVNNKLFVRQRGAGLMRWNGSNLERIKGGEIFDTTGVFLMMPFGENSKKILIGTQEKGFWMFEPQNSSNNFQRFNVEDVQLLKKAIITGGVYSGNGSFAISTMQSGIIVIDTAGKTKAIIDNKHGLYDNDVKNLLLDQDQNLGLALNNGISRVEISSPLSVITDKSGLTGSINTVIRFKNILYAGTTTGLFVTDPGNKTDIIFKPVSGLTVPVRSLVEAGGSLLAGTDEGLFQVLSNKILRISNEKSYTLCYSPEMKLLLSGGTKGLTAFKCDDEFKKVNSLKIEGEDIIGIVAEKKRTGTAPEFWLGTRYNGVIRIRINKDLSFVTDSYKGSDGLTDGKVIPSVVDSITVFETSTGLFDFTNENIIEKLVPEKKGIYQRYFFFIIIYK